MKRIILAAGLVLAAAAVLLTLSSVPQPAPPSRTAHGAPALPSSGRWTAISDGPLSRQPNWPTRADLYNNGGIEGPSGILQDFAGAWHIPEGWKGFTGGAMCFNGGGRHHGSSNGVYCWDFALGTVKTLSPEYPYDATAKRPNGTTYSIPSKAPGGNHNYGSKVVVGDSLFFQPMALYADTRGDSGQTPYYWELKDGTWITHDDRVPSFVSSVYYPPLNLIITIGANNDYAAFDPDAGRNVKAGTFALWKRHINRDMGLVYDPDRDVVWILSRGDLFQAKVGDDGSLRHVGRQIDVPGIKSGQAGLEYHANALWVWDGSKTVLKYDILSNRWTAFTPDTGPEKYNGYVYNKWMWSPYLKAFVGITDARSPVWAFIPPEEAGAEPDTEPAPAPDPSPAAPTDPAPAPAAGAGPSKVPPTGARIPTRAESGLPAFHPSNRPVPIPTGDTCGISGYLGRTGDQLYIGITTEWTAEYLAGRADLLATIMCQGNLRLWDDPKKKISGEFAHTPSLYWVPWLLTHDEKYVEEMEKQLLAYQRWRDPDHPFTKEPNWFPYNQRITAWQLRNYAELVKARPSWKPAFDRLRDFFLSEVADDKVFLTHPDRDGYMFWEESFLTQTLAHIVMLGFDDWKPILDYEVKLYRGWDYKFYDGYRGFKWTGNLEADKAAHAARYGYDQVPDGTLATNSPGSRNIRAQQVLAGFGMAAEAGADTCDLYLKYKALLQRRLGSDSVPSRTNPVVNCPHRP